ncbi:hypothetical protein OC835_000409 [Tilletia horrida]|nr:hypothetical protein OC835_000409 [Tilletia horrida]
MPELSSYEQQRLENIRRNEALMRELDLLNGASSLGIDPATTRRAKAAADAEASSSASGRARAKAKITPAEAKARKEAAEKRKADKAALKASKAEAEPTRIQPPRRSSARLAGVEADSAVLKRKYEEAVEREREERELAKKARHEEMDLKRLTGGGLSEEDVRALRAAFEGLAEGSGQGEGAEDETMRAPKGKTKAKAEPPSIEMAELKEELDKMELGAVSKVVQRRIYSLAYHPTPDKDLIFAGDKEGAIGVWEPWAKTGGGGDDEADDEEEGVDASKASGLSWSLQAHGKDAVTSLKFDPVDAQSLFSSSYDSTIRHLSLQASEGQSGSTEVWAGESDVLLSVFDVLAPQTHAGAFTSTPAPGLEERSLWIADHRGGLIHVDLRERPRIGGGAGSTPTSTRGGRGAKAGHQGASTGATSRRWQVQEKKIGGLSVNPLWPYAVATAGLDQHVRLFDVRALATLPLVMEAPYNATAVDQEGLGEVQGAAQLASCRARLACTSVDWSPRGTQLAALSYDDVVKVWDVKGSDLEGGVEAGGSSSSSSSSRRATVPRSSNTRSGRRSAVKKEEEDAAEGTLLKYFKSEPQADEAGASSPGKAGAASNRASSPQGSSKMNFLEQPTHTFPHNNQTGKWLTMFRVKWNGNANAEPHFSLGSMHRHAEIWSGAGELLRSLYDEEWVTAVPAVTAMHPRRVGRLVAGNASGKCYLWCPPPEQP